MRDLRVGAGEISTISSAFFFSREKATDILPGICLSNFSSSEIVASSASTRTTFIFFSPSSTLWVSLAYYMFLPPGVAVTWYCYIASDDFWLLSTTTVSGWLVFVYLHGDPRRSFS